MNLCIAQIKMFLVLLIENVSSATATMVLKVLNIFLFYDIAIQTY